ncbi:MAG: Asp-tRNA(Asn)/Glu-tRNA(Gln) amidotransferase subunit GatC [Bdellovibrionota bacterium]
MVEVNEILTRQVASLARLELSDLEVKLFTSQLGTILKYVDQLQMADVNGIEPLTHPLSLATPMREDEVKSFIKTAEGKPRILDCAPEVMYDGFKVPPII